MSSNETSYSIWFNKPFIFLFLVSAVLRITLSFVNLEANDNHLLVSQKLMTENSLLSWSDCGSCYHPKLFHATAAGFMQAFKITNHNNQMILGQLLNTLAGLLALVFIALFIQQMNWKRNVQYIVFALIAFNPKIIAINSQFSNDTFVMLFATIGLYALYQFIKTNRTNHLCSSTLAILLACLSKGSGLVIAIVAVVIMLVTIILHKQQITKQLSVLVLFVVLLVGVVPFAGNYYDNYKASNELFGLNGNKSEAPHLTKETFVDRPGVTSISKAYFTFRFIDLVKNPYIRDGYEGYAKNRTSVWSQIYGRSLSAHFDQWPKSWQSLHPKLLLLMQLILLLGLLPLGLFLIGVAKEKLNFLKNPFRQSLKNGSYIHLLFVGAMIAMMIKLTYEHRDFCTMKFIYMLPAILPFTYFLGLCLLQFNKNKLLLVGCWLLVCLQIVDIILLIDQLAWGNYQIDLLPFVQL